MQVEHLCLYAILVYFLGFQDYKHRLMSWCNSRGNIKNKKLVLVNQSKPSREVLWESNPHPPPVLVCSIASSI